MNKIKRIFSLTICCACFIMPMRTALAEQVSAANFEPDETPEVGSHGEVDQSALLDLPTVEPLEPLDGTSAEPLLDGIDYDGESESREQNDDYADADDLLPGAEGDNADNGIQFDNDTEFTPEEPNQMAESVNGIPVPTAMPVVDVSTMQFSALTDASLGFTFNYPTNWDNIPGLHTVCFREHVEDGDFPARIAVSVKRMTHTVQEDVMVEQLTRFMRTISKQYASSTFQPGKVNYTDSFMGRPAYSNTYLAYYGDIEVEGFIIGCAVGKAIVVAHFSASYEDYQSMYNVMRYMLNSAQLLAS